MYHKANTDTSEFSNPLFPTNLLEVRRMISAYGRGKLRQEDLQFIITSLCREGEKEATLLKLLADPDTRDAMLDHPRLLACLLEKQRTASLSLFLYFYILVRQALKTYNIDDRAVSDYVAGLLAEFARGNRAYRVDSHSAKEYRYLVDIMQDLLEANSEQTFHLRSHLGNYALFLTGLFPDFVYHRVKYHPPSPDFSYYEQVGSNNFHLAAQHAMAERYRLSEILELLGRRFQQVRLALNHMADRFLHMDRNPGATDKVMRRVDHFIDTRQ